MYYYWDTFWIIKGLLLSDMHDTARGILRNMAHVMQVLELTMLYIMPWV